MSGDPPGDPLMHDHEYHPLTVVDVADETSDTRSFVLDVPSHLTATFAYAAGQFCTFRATIDGEPVVRCYSMSSSPDVGDPLHDDREARSRRPHVQLDERHARRAIRSR